MPYIPKMPQRAQLDTHIDRVIEAIKTHQTTEFLEKFGTSSPKNVEAVSNHLLRLQRFCVNYLACITHPDFRTRIQQQWERLDHFEPVKNQPGRYGLPPNYVMQDRETTVVLWLEFMPLLFPLARNIGLLTKEADPLSWVGMLNYCVTETLLLSTSGRRYHDMEGLRAVCHQAIHDLSKLLYDNDWRMARIIQIFSDISDEFYRRIVAPYEDKQIDKLATHGDTRGYLAWK